MRTQFTTVQGAQAKSGQVRIVFDEIHAEVENIWVFCIFLALIFAFVSVVLRPHSGHRIITYMFFHLFFSLIFS